MRFFVFSLLAEAGQRSGRTAEVRALIDELAPVAATGGAPALAIALAYARAVTADGDDAEAAYDAALAQDLTRWPVERARLQLAYGAWLRRRRNAARSRQPLRAAAATFDQLGNAPWADQARAELRASGESLRRPIDARVTLTPQELQIARLAAEGLSNREIAEKLFLSPRTVTTHLYRIYPKLGVSARTELARVMINKGT
ncbi:helix-turn-helix transcriptional regulator [Asanoa iriomotensis]|uniref:helix-turn-helix transcriptional regulator n=1 Tax=Asanoa iriomotensis TaxID=234613 RepID=UPI001942A8F7|nr:response regulator transcription factor [Asanoa iriomotensis]